MQSIHIRTPECQRNPDANPFLRDANAAHVLNPMQAQFAAFTLDPSNHPQATISPYLASPPQNEGPKDPKNPFLATSPLQEPPKQPQNPWVANPPQNENANEVYDFWNTYIKARDNTPPPPSSILTTLLHKLETSLDKTPSCTIWLNILASYCHDCNDHNNIDKRLQDALTHRFRDLDGGFHRELNLHPGFEALKRNPCVAPALVTFLLECVVGCVR
ncbi:MAG: hypothetical protein Q9186_003512 [Xanthomendoza sp. 1 TL-2023]